MASGRIQKIQKEGAEKQTTHEHPWGYCTVPLERRLPLKQFLKNLRKKKGGAAPLFPAPKCTHRYRPLKPPDAL